jgi:RHS repeat-associated protein
VYYYHLDHIGLPRALTNSAGQVVWSATARPFGDISETTFVDPISGRTVVTNLRLPGQYDERLFAAAGITGLQGPYYNWNRWYLPSVGRYLELDPVALRGGFNGLYGPDWYGYAGDNPLRRTDRTGRTWWDDWWGDYPDKFKQWMHKQKQEGDADFSKKEVEEGYEEWKRQGEPGPDNKGKHRGPQPPIPPVDPWEVEIGPIFFIHPCVLFPDLPMCHPEKKKDPNFCGR